MSGAVLVVWDCLRRWQVPLIDELFVDAQHFLHLSSCIFAGSSYRDCMGNQHDF